MQETGRGGRDGEPSLSLLLATKRSSQYTNKTMIEYQQNTAKCRRDFVFQDIDDYHHTDTGSVCLCCYICIRLVNVVCAKKSALLFILCNVTDTVLYCQRLTVSY